MDVRCSSKLIRVAREFQAHTNRQRAMMTAAYFFLRGLLRRLDSGTLCLLAKEIRNKKLEDCHHDDFSADEIRTIPHVYNEGENYSSNQRPLSVRPYNTRVKASRNTSCKLCVGASISRESSCYSSVAKKSRCPLFEESSCNSNKKPLKISKSETSRRPDKAGEKASRNISCKSSSCNISRESSFYSVAKKFRSLFEESSCNSNEKPLKKSKSETSRRPDKTRGKASRNITCKPRVGANSSCSISRESSCYSVAKKSRCPLFEESSCNSYEKPLKKSKCKTSGRPYNTKDKGSSNISLTPCVMASSSCSISSESSCSLVANKFSCPLFEESSHNSCEKPLKKSKCKTSERPYSTRDKESRNTSCEPRVGANSNCSISSESSCYSTANKTSCPLSEESSRNSYENSNWNSSQESSNTCEESSCTTMESPIPIGKSVWNSLRSFFDTCTELRERFLHRSTDSSNVCCEHCQNSKACQKEGSPIGWIQDNIVSSLFPRDLCEETTTFFKKQYNEFCLKCFGQYFIFVLIVCLILYELPMQIPMSY